MFYFTVTNMYSKERSSTILCASRAIRTSIVLITAALLAGCAVGPASREDYSNLYYDSCMGAGATGGFERPVYCDR